MRLLKRSSACSFVYIERDVEKSVGSFEWKMNMLETIFGTFLGIELSLIENFFNELVRQQVKTNVIISPNKTPHFCLRFALYTLGYLPFIPCAICIKASWIPKFYFQFLLPYNCRCMPYLGHGLLFQLRNQSSLKEVIASLLKHKPRYTYSLFDLTWKYSHFWEEKRHKLWRMKWMWKTLSNEAKEKLFLLVRRWDSG